MAEYPYMPLWTDTFISDTMDLDATETGAYMMLLMIAWRSPECELPNNDVKLARFARCSERQWKRIKPTVLQFWTVKENGNLEQKRLTKEREKVSEIKTKRAAAGERGAKAKWQKTNDDGMASAKSEPLANGQQNDSTYTYSHTHTHKESNKEEGAASAEPKPYVFEGHIVRLTRKDFDQWQTAYSEVPDFMSELQAADAYYAENPPKDGKWFFPVSNWLKKEHQRFAEKKRRAKEAERELYRGCINYHV